LQSTFYPIKGNPPAILSYSIIYGVPTKRLVPVSTIPVFKAKLFPLTEIEFMAITHHQARITG